MHSQKERMFRGGGVFNMDIPQLVQVCYIFFAFIFQSNEDIII